jgi:ASC-1-like (ASCH) protein
MELGKFDNKYVRIETIYDEIFEGECRYDNADYSFHEFGRYEDLLNIDNWMFYRSDIRNVEVTEEKETYIWNNRRGHRMKLDPKMLRMMELGKKTIELRLYDEKRRKLRVGDDIRFEGLEEEPDVIHMVVEELYVFDSFAELYKVLPLMKCGYTEKTIENASPEDMNRYYTEEEQKKYGVVGILLREAD